MIPTTNEVEIKSICYSAINSYSNANIGIVTRSQLLNMGPFVQTIINMPIDSILDRIIDIEDNVVKSGLSVGEQNPVLMSSMIEQSMHSYFLSEIALGGGSAWNTYLSAALASAIINLPYWDGASFVGAWLGAKSTVIGMVPSTVNKVDVELFSCLTGALTIAAGKIIFKWMPKVKQMPTMSKSRMIENGGCNCKDGSGGGETDQKTCPSYCLHDYASNLATCAEIAEGIAIFDPPAGAVFYLGCGLLAFGGYRDCCRGGGVGGVN